GIRDKLVTGVQTCALPICNACFNPMNSHQLEQLAHASPARCTKTTRRLPFPVVTDPEALPLRPARHIPNSIATMRRRLIAALVKIGRASCRERVYSSVGCE